MKARITFGETDVGGLMSRKRAFSVTLIVDLTEEERHIFEYNELDDIVLLQRPPWYGARLDGIEPEFFFLRGKDLRGEDTYICGTIADAKAYAVELEEALGSLKVLLETSAELPDPIDIEL